jgi:amino acid transporter
VALVYAMFASAVPRSGGDYVYIPILHESRPAGTRGLATIASRQTATGIAKVIPIPCDLPLWFLTT